LRRRTVLASGLAFVVLSAVLAGCSSDGGETSRRPTPHPSLKRRRIGGLDIGVPVPTVPPDLKPYPYVTPTPPPVATPLDGTYMKIRTLAELGGVPNALPIKCLRCAPFQPHPGVTTLILHRGTYYEEHQMSGFKTLGHYVVNGRRISFFNDVNCTQERGRYRWARRGDDLILGVVHDACSGKSRAVDFTTLPWTRVDPCDFRILRVWPAPLECA
jgi:hypothetical protein